MFDSDISDDSDFSDDGDIRDDGDSFDINYAQNKQLQQNQNINTITTPLTSTLALIPQHVSLQPPPPSHFNRFHGTGSSSGIL